MKIYTPVFKTKSAELRALNSVAEGLGKHILPLVEITALAVDLDSGKPKISVAKHLDIVSKRMQKAWGSRRAYVDPFALRSTLDEGRSGAVNDFFQKGWLDGARWIPVISLGSSLAYQNLIRHFVKDGLRRLCLRLQPSQLTSEADRGAIEALLELIGVSPRQVDLVIDYGQITVQDGQRIENELANILQGLPFLMEWKRIVFVGTAMPTSFGHFPKNRISVARREEWRIWEAIANRSGLPRTPDFGDYGISHPGEFNFDPRFMKIGAKILYATPDSWMLSKGTVWTEDPSQYSILCDALIRTKAYSGPDFSAADKHIRDCAKRKIATGNPATWVYIGTLRHIYTVIAQLASFDES